ncbi:MAG: hypothetical protein KJ072_07330, partial [Verrucomicrobia bacterium]|nr:hypothetical protein [Verrucomicrobiota bacterium]
KKPKGLEWKYQGVPPNAGIAPQPYTNAFRPAWLHSSFACMKKVVLILAVVVVVAAGAFYVQRSRVKSAQPCWGKLVNIEGAKEQWAIESKATSGTPVTVENILPYLANMPTCHLAGATYIIGKIGEEPRCTVHGTVSHFNPDQY